MIEAPAKWTDFNDLAFVNGFDAVAEAVNQAQPVKEPSTWPDPIMPGQAKTPAIPTDVLPDWVAAMAQAVAASTQTPPALAVMTGLAVLATVLQRRFEVAPYGNDYTEPLPLWTSGVSPSGGRKTAVQNAMIGPVVRWEKLTRDRMRGDIAKNIAVRAVAKKRIEKLQLDAAKAKDASERESITQEIQQEEVNTPDELRAPRLFTGDTTAERLQAMLVEHGERMAVLSDEAGIFLVMAGIYSGGVANIDVFLQGHAGSPLRVDRAGRCAHVDKPALSFGLLMQPDVMSEVASSRRFRGSGLLARFLYAIPESNVGKRDVRANVPIPEHVKQTYEAGIFRLLEGAGGAVEAPKVLTLSDEAKEAWLLFSQEIEHSQGEGSLFDSITDWTCKLPGAVARIAALIELAESGTQATQVSHSAMARAVRLAWLLVPHAQAAFGLLGTDGTDADAIAIVKWFRANDLAVFTRRDAQKAQEGRFRSVERLQKALDRLEHQDVLRSYKRHNKGAPPTAMFQINPKALSR